VANNKWRFLLIVPGVALGAPVAEELLFRGFLFAALAPSRVGKAGTVLITSALWALAHAGPAPWVIVGGIFLMGIVLGVLLLRFGSLWLTIVLHAIWNGLQTWGLFNLGSQ
jgi:membrane protease YdiL (CAAX protease family)